MRVPIGIAIECGRDYNPVLRSRQSFEDDFPLTRTHLLLIRRDGRLKAGG